jgi:hypothetical protein
MPSRAASFRAVERLFMIGRVRGDNRTEDGSNDELAESGLPVSRLAICIIRQPVLLNLLGRRSVSRDDEARTEAV